MKKFKYKLYELDKLENKVHVDKTIMSILAIIVDTSINFNFSIMLTKNNEYIIPNTKLIRDFNYEKL
jgi:hypothetical protein